MNIHSIASNLKKAAEPILFQPLKCGVMKIIGDIYFWGITVCCSPDGIYFPVSPIFGFGERPLKAKQSDCPSTSLAPTITVGLCVSVVGPLGFRGRFF
jgi:hypothetical protein